MKKKIISISMVKNEMDIIETFVRYHATFIDEMLILDNRSSDATVGILNNLKDEGIPLHIIIDGDPQFRQAVKTSELLHRAVKEFGADVVVALDADEFIVSSEGGNPREYLEKIDSSTYFKARWKTYIPDFKSEKRGNLIFDRITSVRDDSVEEFCKVIIPAELVKRYSVKLAAGNHDLVYNNKYADCIKKIISNDLRIAHFPVRSREQITSKVIIGWLNSLSDPSRKPDENFHWKLMYDEYKRDTKISIETIIGFALNYGLSRQKRDIIVRREPFDLSFCDNIYLCYTHEKFNMFLNILEYLEEFSLKMLEVKKELHCFKKDSLKRLPVGLTNVIRLIFPEGSFRRKLMSKLLQ